VKELCLKSYWAAVQFIADSHPNGRWHHHVIARSLADSSPRMKDSVFAAGRTRKSSMRSPNDYPEVLPVGEFQFIQFAQHTPSPRDRQALDRKTRRNNPSSESCSAGNLLSSPVPTRVFVRANLWPSALVRDPSWQRKHAEEAVEVGPQEGSRLAGGYLPFSLSC
jgi:hypothetical protein